MSRPGLSPESDAIRACSSPLTGKRARSSLPRAVYPQATTVHGDKCQDQIFQRHRIDALQSKNHHTDYVDYHPQEPVFDIFACHQNHRHDRQHHHARVPERKASGCSTGIVTCNPSICIMATATRVRTANTGSIYRVIKPIAITHIASHAIAFGNGSQRILSSASLSFVCRDHAYQP